MARPRRAAPRVSPPGLPPRLHPRRLRHRLPLALAVAVAAVSLPRAVLSSADPGPGRSVLIAARDLAPGTVLGAADVERVVAPPGLAPPGPADRKSTRLNSSHANISYAVFCLKIKL